MRDLDADRATSPCGQRVGAQPDAGPTSPSRSSHALADLRSSADRLIIEITETALLTDPAKRPAALAELDRHRRPGQPRRLRHGQTSLGYLSSLPVHELKIDKSFVTDMLDNPAHAAIVRSIVDLGHNLGLRVVGEGVETDETLHALAHAGCDVAQGYGIARPMPADALHEWITNAASPIAATNSP